MQNQTTLTPEQMDSRALRTLISNVVGGIPVELSSLDAKYWNAHRAELHQELRRILIRNQVIETLLKSVQHTIEWSGKLRVINIASCMHLPYEYINSTIRYCSPSTHMIETLCNGHLISFNRAMKSDVVIKFFERMNLIPGGIHELIARDIQFPMVTGETPIVALGTDYLDNGIIVTPASEHTAKIYGLGLYEWAGEWNKRCRFLAIEP